MKKKDLKETTWSGGNYPDDGTGVATDDDRPPGNILLGPKYKEKPFFNRLTSFVRNWEPDIGDWKWDHFEMAGGMEDYDNYSQSLQTMASLFPDDTWENVWKRMTQVGDKETDRSFDKAGQPWRDAETGQIGKDDVVSALPPEELAVESLLKRIDILIM